MIEVVCGIIRDERGRVLAGLRPQGKHLGGLWEFPGGKVDPGESPQQALVRELREELGIEVGVGAALEPVCWEYESGMIRLWPFVCTMLGGEMTVLSHERVAWVGLDELEEFDWAPADVPVLGQTRAFFARDMH